MYSHVLNNRHETINFLAFFSTRYSPYYRVTIISIWEMGRPVQLFETQLRTGLAIPDRPEAKHQRIQLTELARRKCAAH